MLNFITIRAIVTPMHILEIIPLQKGIPRDSLSYFSLREIPLGALVEIPLQSRTISGIVIGKTDARDVKATIRSGTFSLKPVGPVIQEKGFPSKIIQTLWQLSMETLIPTGTLLSTFFPEPVFEYFQNWKSIVREKPELRLIELDTPDRFDYYKILVREAFAKKLSIQFITPTVIESDRLVNFLQEICEKEKVIQLSGGMTPAKREKNYQQLLAVETPLVICTTPQFFIIPRHDIGSCIIDSSGSPYYVQDFSLPIDYRVIINRIAETLGINRYFSDSLLPPEQRQLMEMRKAFMDRTSKKTSVKTPVILLEKETFKDPYYVSPVLSSKAVATIKEMINQKKPLFIFSARKGVATVTTCRDCGYTVQCPNCNSVMQLIKKNPLAEADRVFTCNRCETEVPPMNRCPHCLGWNLIPLGITTESIAEELKKFFPDQTILQSSQELTKTESACKKMIKTWQETNGILVGTQKIIQYIDHIPTTIIASFEHCMSIPDFQTPFQTMWLFQKLHEKTTDYFCIQTKNKNDNLLQSLIDHTPEKFISEDIQLRKQYHYPPFSALITIQFSAIKRKDHPQAKEYLKKSITDYEHSIQSQFFEYGQHYQITAKIHVPIQDWTDPENPKKQLLLNFLQSIRNHADITIETGLH